MLDQAKAGDKVWFNAEEIGGHYVVTRIAPEPAESELLRAGFPDFCEAFSRMHDPKVSLTPLK